MKKILLTILLISLVQASWLSDLEYKYGLGLDTGVHYAVADAIGESLLLAGDSPEMMFLKVNGLALIWECGQYYYAGSFDLWCEIYGSAEAARRNTRNDILAATLASAWNYIGAKRMKVSYFNKQFQLSVRI